MARIAIVALLVAASLGNLPAGPPYAAVIIDGQNNHDWKATTPILKSLLEQTRLFRVDVATTPPKGGNMTAFEPDFRRYAVIVSNYNGDAWPAPVQVRFVEYVRSGGGFVVFHAADNAFPEWPEYNEMIGVGGWGNRNESAGPYVRFRDGKLVLDNSPGRAGSHGPQHEFKLTVRDRMHPVTRGLPEEWMHVKDELYDRLRGPARNLSVLATAFSAPDKNGTGEHEPMLLAIRFGQGRVFHTALGHGPEAMSGVGFIVTLQRGTEWAACGRVTQPVPSDFPSASEARRR